MKKLIYLICVSTICTTNLTNAQTVDEILNSYFENTGGKESWKQLEGVKINAKVMQGNMEIPIEIVQLKSGKQYTKVTFQGNVIMQNVFNGKELWGTNFQSMKAEKSDQEAADNMQLDSNDFPDSFLDYEEKGYEVELMGKETFEGSETFKVKLKKEPKTYDGVATDDIMYFYFDTESMVPLGQESIIAQGELKGQIQQVTMSDYQEIEGYYFPFSMTQGIKGQESQPINIESIELNPTIDNSIFNFPSP